MTSKTMVDDVRIWPVESDKGYPILFTNPEIRRMLTLARVGRDDIIYDLGCGWAQNLIIAATEFGVKKCVGLERLQRRYLKAKERIRNWGLSDRVKLINGQYEDLFEENSKYDGIREATVVLYLLETDPDLATMLDENLQDGCRIVYFYNGLFPEIKPDAVDYPFYVSVIPFKRPVSTLDWLRSVVLKPHASLNRRKFPSESELWDELHHDYQVMGLGRNYVKTYHSRLRKALTIKR